MPLILWFRNKISLKSVKRVKEKKGMNAKPCLKLEWLQVRHSVHTEVSRAFFMQGLRERERSDFEQWSYYCISMVKK